MFADPAGEGAGWAADHPLAMAVVWPAVLTAALLQLAVRAFQRRRR